MDECSSEQEGDAEYSEKAGARRETKETNIRMACATLRKYICCLEDAATRCGVAEPPPWYADGDGHRAAKARSRHTAT